MNGKISLKSMKRKVTALYIFHVKHILRQFYLKTELLGILATHLEDLLLVSVHRGNVSRKLLSVWELLITALEPLIPQ